MAAVFGLAPPAFADLLKGRAFARGGPAAPAAGAAWKTLTIDEARTLAAVQEVLWPADEGVPGAGALRATEVLDAALSHPDTPPIFATWVRGGLPRLHEVAAERGAARFEALDPAAQEAVLVAVRDTLGGDGWLRLVLRYTLEAVLGDPIHGGNVGEAGWTWAGFVPGEPRPPAAAR